MTLQQEKVIAFMYMGTNSVRPMTERIINHRGT